MAGPGPTVEEFARQHGLPPRWVELRRRSEAIVRDPRFWYDQQLQTAARQLALEASEILDRVLRKAAAG